MINFSNVQVPVHDKDLTKDRLCLCASFTAWDGVILQLWYTGAIIDPWSVVYKRKDCDGPADRPGYAGRGYRRHQSFNAAFADLVVQANLSAYRDLGDDYTNEIHNWQWDWDESAPM